MVYGKKTKKIRKGIDIKNFAKITQKIKKNLKVLF